LTRRAQETAGGNVLRMQARLYDLLEEATCKQVPPDVRRVRSDVPEWLSIDVIALLARQATSRPTAVQAGRNLRDRKEARSDEAIRRGQVAQQANDGFAEKGDRMTTTKPESVAAPKPETVTPATTVTPAAIVTPVASSDPQFLPMAGNEAQFEALLNEAFNKVSYLWIRYDKPTDEDTDTKEEITDRWVLPMTVVFDGTKQRRYFRAECMHARMEKDAQRRKEEDEHIHPSKCFSYKMTTDRCFRFDRIEYFCTELKPLTERNRHYAELLNTYPQLRQRLGLQGAGDPTEVHRMMIWQCMNLTNKTTSPFCNTALGIALDMRSTGFVCPNCGAIYLVDPIKPEEGVPNSEEFMVFEVDGHRIEAVFGQSREKILRNPSRKLGASGRVFTATVY
jgi:hypothetical protein